MCRVSCPTLDTTPDTLLIRNVSAREIFLIDKLTSCYFHLQGTPVNIIVGSHVWIEDPDISWVDGQVSKITGQDAEIETTNGKKVLYFLLIFTLINLHTYSIEMLQKLYKEKANSEYMLFYFGYF